MDALKVMVSEKTIEPKLPTASDVLAIVQHNPSISGRDILKQLTMDRRYRSGAHRAIQHALEDGMITLDSHLRFVAPRPSAV